VNDPDSAALCATVLAPTAVEYTRLLGAEFPDMTFRPATEETEACAAMPGCEVLVAFGISMSDAILRAGGPGVRWIQSLATGVDRFQALPSFRPDMILTSARGIHAPQVAEMATMQMIALNRQLPRAVMAQQARRWDRFPAPILAGKTVVVWGIGAIGAEIGRICKAFNMTVWGVTRTPRDLPQFDRFFAPSEMTEAASGADYLIAIAPSEKENLGRIDATLLAGMKPTAFIINLGRGELINDEALIAALVEGRIAGAALDVFTAEPLPEDHAYWGMDNVIVTPHVAGMSVEYECQAVALVAENIAHYRAGALHRMVNRVQ
jgi:phosphoglycerate dehydrogenase-like enzyme